MAKQGARVSVYDMRNDLRQDVLTGTVKQRSICLSLCARGVHALSQVGLDKVFRSISVPMYGRFVHKLNEPSEFHPYGQPSEHLLSLSRAKLTSTLLDACDEHADIEMHFQTKCCSVDLKKPSATFRKKDGQEFTVCPTLIVGADGTHSRVREAMSRLDGFNFSKTFFEAAYKELPFTMDTSGTGFPKEVLHIWPRGSILLLALPRVSKLDNNFTVTLFMPRTKFEELDTKEKVMDFFTSMFPDALEGMPNVAEDFMRNPTQSLYTVRCSPFNYGGNAVMIGDAAHTVVPFYGQGCNASFEDCTVLYDIIQRHGWDMLPKALAEYSRARKPNVDAIAQLAINQYQDMSKNSTSRLRVAKRQMDIALNRMFPQWFVPLYSLVCFTNTPYLAAVERAKQQDSILAYALGAMGLVATMGVAMMAYSLSSM